MNSHPDRIEEYKRSLERYKIELVRAEAQREQEATASALYEVQVQQHADGQRRAHLAREQLRNAARVCRRCGSAYLGP